MSTSEGAPAAPEGAVAPVVPVVVAPAAVSPAAAPILAPAPVLPVVPDKQVKMSSEAFKKRLEEGSAATTRKLLKELGYDTVEAAVAGREALKKLQDAALTEGERAAKQLRELTESAALAKGQGAIAEEAVAELFGGLTDKQRAAIDKQAPANPAERLKLIRFARELGAVDPAVAAAAAAPLVAAPVIIPPAPALATTAAAANAPKPGAAPNKLEEFKALDKINPIASGAFYNANRVEIEKLMALVP